MRTTGSAVEEPILTKEGLRDKLTLPSTRSVDEMVKKKKIPVLRLGHKTVRFSWPRVCESLARLEERAVS